MSDLTGNGRIAATNGGASRLGPVPVSQQGFPLQQPPPIPEALGGGGGRQGSPSQIPAGMRTPRTIMAERQRKAEALKLQQEAEEQQQRQILAEQQRRRQQQQQQQAVQSASQAIQGGGHRRTQSSTAGLATRDSGYQTGGYPSRQQTRQDEPSMGRLPDPPPVPTQQQQQTASQQQQQQQRSRANTLGEPRPVPQQIAGQGSQRTQPRAAAQPQSQSQPQATSGASQRRSRRPTDPEPEAGPSTAGTGAQRSTQSSFPHAFERWEDLSSHWEGLTSFWIHKLEHDAEEVSRIPLGQQMSRQITDLAAAGANLFHAVVELQRLRASSERKFSRWFIETRRDLERAAEVNADLERELAVTRDQQRLSGGQAQELERRAQRADKIADEARRELAIAKDEARRAWEELGRREQEDRERQQALRDGIPILISGVQVFPTPAGASRQASLSHRPTTRDGSTQQQQGYAQVPTGGTQYVGQQQPMQPYVEETSPTDTDPFTETRAQQQGYVGVSPYIAGATPATSTASARTMIPASQGVSSQPPSRSGPQQQTQQRGGLYSHPATSAEQYQQQQYIPTTSAGGESESYVETPSNDGGDNDEILSASDGDEDEDDDADGEGEWEIDSQGNIRLDARGQPVLWRRGLLSTANDDDEDDVRDDIQRERLLARQYGTAGGSSTAAQQQQQQQQPVTYPPIPPSSSAGLAPAGGAATAAATGPGGHLTVPYAPGPPPAEFEEGDDRFDGQGQPPQMWETMRHHHPTRLSDVMEEDERSRTTAE